MTVGIIVLTGLTISGAKRLFLRACGRGGYHVEIITGIVGTPVHELSHALFCLIFGHKIKGICLWTPNPQNGTLGYVTHTYRPKNLWHQIGNFFIGVAPIIGGSGMLLLLLWLLLPDAAGAVFSVAYEFPTEPLGVPMALLRQAWTLLQALFLPGNFVKWHWYLYVLLAILIVLHMEISRSDLKSGLWGFLFISILWLLADLALFFLYPEGLMAVTDASVAIGAFLASFLGLAVILSAVLLLISFIVMLVRRR